MSGVAMNTSAGLALVWPVLAQVLLTLVILGLLGRARVAAVRAKRVKIAAVALSNEGWPDEVRRFSNNLANQFETPVLFYVLVAAAIHVGATGWPMVVLAWIFVASRVAHAVVHTTSNHVLTRFRIFLVGLAALGMMLLVVAARLLAG
ncbi:MAG: MAPEG family protein [Burkholderiales bacterium]|nr:MAPEG family protein [Burkholderiales bacterium]